MEPRLKLNVGGRHHEVLISTLMKYPESTLAILVQRWNQENTEENKSKEHFFDRNPTVFEAILDIYRSNLIVCPPAISEEVFNAELLFWGFTPIKSKKEKDFVSLLNMNKLAMRILLNERSDTQIGMFIQGVISTLKNAIVDGYSSINVSECRHMPKSHEKILRKYFNFDKIVEKIIEETQWNIDKDRNAYIVSDIPCTNLQIYNSSPLTTINLYKMPIHIDAKTNILRFVRIYTCSFSLK